MSPRLVFITVLAVAACGDAVGSSSEAIAPPAGKPDPPPPSPGPQIVFGEPLPPPNMPTLGEITVEAVEGPRTRILSRFDNPELRTLVELPNYSQFIGGGFFLDSQTPALTNGAVTPGFVTFVPGDLRMYTSGEDATPVDGDGIPVTANRAAVATSLIPWPEADVSLDGGEGDTADLYARGVRLGYTPLTVQTLVTNPNGTLGARLSSIEISLDPNVILVPVQVFAINSPTIRNYGGLGNVLGNLEVWDQVPAFLPSEDAAVQQTSYSFGSWFGEVGSWGPATVSATWERLFQAYRPGGKLVPLPSDVSAAPDNSFYFSPDSIWRDCGVQFRLVRFDSVELTDDETDCDSLARGAGCADKLNDNTDRLNADIHDVCDRFESVVIQKKLAGNLPDIPTVIVSYRLADVGTNGAGDVAITVDGFGETGPVSCVGSQAETGARQLVLAHEVGHWAGGALKDDCGLPGGACEINAQNVTDQRAPPSDAECKIMRGWAIQQWASFWGCRSRGCVAPPPIFPGSP